MPREEEHEGVCPACSADVEEYSAKEVLQKLFEPENKCELYCCPRSSMSSNSLSWDHYGGPRKDCYKRKIQLTLALWLELLL